MTRKHTRFWRAFRQFRCRSSHGESAGLGRPRQGVGEGIHTYKAASRLFGERFEHHLFHIDRNGRIARS
jgi:hypothetical protein